MKNTYKFFGMRLIPVILLVLATLASCDKDNKDYNAFNQQRNIDNYLVANGLSLTPRPSGLYFDRLYAGSGLALPVDTQFVQLDFMTRLLDGKQVDGTPYSTNRIEWAQQVNISPLYAQGTTALFKMGGTYYEPALSEALREMTVGDSVRLVMKPALAGIPGNKYPVVLLVKFRGIIADLLQWERQRIAAYLDTIPEERITPYELLVPGSTLKDTIYFISYGGARNDSVANLGDQVVLDYYGKYIDGTGFELRKEATLTVQKASSGKSDAVIDGLAEALRHVNPGEKVSVVIPYRLAYGSVDQNETLGDMKMPTVIVPAYSTLVFDLILHKIIPEY